MYKYELKMQNNCGSEEVAMFVKLDDLINYTVDNPLTPKYQYYVIIHKSESIRYDMKMLIDIINAGNRHLIK